MPTRHGPEALDEGKLLAELGLLEAWIALAPVIVRQGCDSLAPHGTRQQARPHRRVDDYANPLAFSKGKDLLLDLAIDERVGRLQRLYKGNRLCPAKLGDVEVGDADVVNEPFLLELGEGRPTLLDLLVGNGPMDLVQVDRLDAEALEAPLELTPERVAPQALDGRPVRAFGLAGFREDVRTVRAELAERASDDFLGVAEAVLRCRVDPIDTELDRVVDRRDGVRVLLVTPAPVVAAAPDRPGAQADPRDLESGLSQLRCLELCPLHRALLSVGST